jgi:acetylornithine/succinyldiaminopimelate/putrescine aminotransferase
MVARRSPALDRVDIAILSALQRNGRSTVQSLAVFAFEHENAQPDGLILGKALGGGMLPVSAFVATQEVMDVFTPGSHGSTFGGNPLAAAVGLEALHVLREERLVERSRDLGTHMIDRLCAVTSPVLKEVRGRGLWAGVETKGVVSKEECDAPRRSRSICRRLSVSRTAAAFAESS